MKEGFLIKANWLVYRSAILKHLPLLGVKDSKKIFRSAKAIYRSEMKRLPEYGKYDVLKLNLSHAVMLGAIYESCEEKPTVDRLARFYREVVLSPGVVHYAFSKNNMVSNKRILRERRQGEKSQFAAHPYTWQYKVEQVGERRFTAVFTRCGICDYLSSRGLSHIIPAMCAMDYTFGEVGKHYFLRKQTLATGGKMCDCTYIGKDIASAEEAAESLQDKYDEASRGGLHFENCQR